MFRHPILRETLLVTCVLIGTVIGLLAGRSFEQGENITLAAGFVGFALFGGFADICLRSYRDD
jgi:hypothetical protein